MDAASTDTARDDTDTPVLKIQPMPRIAKVAYSHLSGGVVTAIARTWKEGDPGRCRLCPQCKADGDMCLVQVPRFVPPELAALFAVVGAVEVGRENGVAL